MVVYPRIRSVAFKPLMIPTLLAAMVVGFVPGLAAQNTEDAAGPMAAIEQMFEGLRTANPEMVRAVFAPDARFAVLSNRADPDTIQAQSVDGWIEAIGRSGGSWNEQIYDVELKVDGEMASAWAPYTFYLDGAVRHCGINSIELLRDGGGWKITQLSDTRRTENCPDPLGGR